MTASVTGHIEQRDLDVILHGLHYGPLANEHLVLYSQHNPVHRPFPDESKVRRRTQILQNHRLIKTRYYAIPSLRGRAYHTLTSDGYRRRFHRDPPLAIRNLFSKVPENNQEHHYWMMHFYVKTLVACRRQGIVFTDYVPENTSPVSAYGRTRDHDGRFRLQLPGVLDFGFFTEIDNHTETLQSSDADGETVEQWLRTYLHHDQQTHTKEQVLLVSTRGGKRLADLLKLARQLNPNPDRMLFLGIDLPAYLAADDPLTGAHCRRPCGRSVPLLWTPSRQVRLLDALRDAPRTLGEIVRHSRRSPHPFTSDTSIKADLVRLYQKGWIRLHHGRCAAQVVYRFEAVVR